MLDFISDDPPRPTVPNNQDIPSDDMEIFYKGEAEFLPPGKTIEDLTPEELRVLQNQYRFSPLRPGAYQGITDISKTLKPSG